MFSIVRPLVMSLTKSLASIFTRVFSRKKNWSIFFLYRTLQWCVKFYAGSQSTLCHCLNTAFFCSVSSRSQICSRYFRLISIFSLERGKNLKYCTRNFLYSDILWDISHLLKKNLVWCLSIYSHRGRSFCRVRIWQSLLIFWLD